MSCQDNYRQREAELKYELNHCQKRNKSNFGCLLLFLACIVLYVLLYFGFEALIRNDYPTPPHQVEKGVYF